MTSYQSPSNALWGKLAEFIVAKATGCESVVRMEWDFYDLLTPQGMKGISPLPVAYVGTAVHHE